MEKILEIDEGILFLNTDGNIYITRRDSNSTIRLKLKDTSYIHDKKSKTLREIFLSIYKKDLYTKVRDVQTRYYLVDENDNKLKNVYLRYSIYKEELSILLIKKETNYLDDKMIELIDIDIYDILEEKKNFKGKYDKILLEMKNVKLKKESKAMKDLKLKINDFYNKYGLELKKESYSIKVAEYYLNSLDKIMINLNSFIKINNKRYQNEVKNVKIDVFLKRFRNKNNLAGYKYGYIEMLVENLDSLSSLEMSFVHEFGHHIDRVYLKKWNETQNSRDNLVWEFIKNNDYKLDYLLRNYEENGKYLTKDEQNNVKIELKSLSNSKEFYRSKYYKNNHDYVKYILDDMEIIARMFEQLYRRELGNNILSGKERIYSETEWEFKEYQLDNLKSILKEFNLAI